MLLRVKFFGTRRYWSKHYSCSQPARFIPSNHKRLYFVSPKTLRAKDNRSEHESEAFELDEKGQPIKPPVKDSEVEVGDGTLRQAWSAAKKEAARLQKEEDMKKGKETVDPLADLDWSNLRQKAEEHATKRAHQDKAKASQGGGAGGPQKGKPGSSGPRAMWEKLRADLKEGPPLTKKLFFRRVRNELIPFTIAILLVGTLFQLLKSRAAHNDDVIEFRGIIDSMAKDSNEVLKLKSEKWENEKEDILEGVDEKKKEKIKKYIEEVLLKPETIPPLPDRRIRTPEPKGPVRFF